MAGTDIDTVAEIDQYDVVVFGGPEFECGWDWATFDSQLEPYVQGGGGLVVTGWGAYYMQLNPRSESYPGLEVVLPFVKGTSTATGGTVTVVTGHPITDGLSDFTNPDADNYGAGPRPGATVLTQRSGTTDGAAWQFGSGRAVYLGPIYLANWSFYGNEPLLDCSTPDAQELFLRAVEWAGAAQVSTAVPGFDQWSLAALTVLFGTLVIWRMRRQPRRR